MTSLLARALRLASLLLCLIVSVSFALFVIDRTGSASAHQTQELNTPAEQAQEGAAPKKKSSESSVRKRIDEASKTVTSPFSGIVEGWHSEWARRGVLLLLALAVYGFGLGFLARMIRVRT